MRLTIIIILSITSLLACRNYSQIPETGYNYIQPLSSSDSDNYHLPLKNKISRHDSFYFMGGERYLYKSFNEPNLSLINPPYPVFRFTIWYRSLPYIITFIGNKIKVKKVISGMPYPKFDDDRLNTLERRHFRLIRSYFPIEERINNSHNSAYLDSMLKKYPQLADINYYKLLQKKSECENDVKFLYQTIEYVPENENFIPDFLKKLYKAGLYTLNAFIDCQETVFHPTVFKIESAFPNKYHFVAFSSCTVNGTETLQKVFQELLLYLKIDTHSH